MATTKQKFYTVARPIGPNEKCPPQAKLIVDTIASAGRIEREALVALLKRPPEEGGLKTEQTAERIFGFYRPRLMKDGILREEVVEVKTEEPAKGATAKPAKASAPKKGKEQAA